MTRADFKFLYKYFAVVYIPALAIAYIFQYTVFSHDTIEALDGAINLAFVASFMSGFTTIWQKKRLRSQIMDFIKHDLPSLAQAKKNSALFIALTVLLYILVYSGYRLIMSEGLYLDSEVTYYAPFNVFLLLILVFMHYKKTKKLLSAAS